MGVGTGMDMGFWEEKGSIDTAPFRVILYFTSVILFFFVDNSETSNSFIAKNKSRLTTSRLKII
jgi:hypothetical protein